MAECRCRSAETSPTLLHPPHEEAPHDERSWWQQQGLPPGGGSRRQPAAPRWRPQAVDSAASPLGQRLWPSRPCLHTPVRGLGQFGRTADGTTAKSGRHAPLRKHRQRVVGRERDNFDRRCVAGQTSSVIVPMLQSSRGANRCGRGGHAHRGTIRKNSAPPRWGTGSNASHDRAHRVAGSSGLSLARPLA